MATADFSFCDFKTNDSGVYGYGSFSGSFSFIPTNSSDEIKCSKLVQTGFQNKKSQIAWEARLLLTAVVDHGSTDQIYSFCMEQGAQFQLNHTKFSKTNFCNMI